MPEQIERTEKFVTAAGLATNYLEMGDGEALLFLHGSGPGVSAWANWSRTLPFFARYFRTLAPDLTGFGATEYPADHAYTIDLWVRQVEDFLDAVGVRKAHLVGNSFGGAVSLAFTSRNPDRVGRLVLMGTAGLVQPVSDAVEKGWGYEPSMENMRRTLEILAYDKSLVTDEMVRFRHEASIAPGSHEAFSRVFPRPFQKAMNAICTSDEDIARIPNRSLVIHGREDGAVPVDIAMRLHKLLKDSELHIFGECGHWAQIEKRERFNDIVLNFLKSE